MATWVAAIVETRARADFWEVARRYGVQPSKSSVPGYALIDCDVGSDFEASFRLAEALSREMSATALGFVVQTTADVHEMHAYRRGTGVRHLGYNRDEGGWTLVEGQPQSWESAYFFDDGSTTAGEGGRWPDMLFDELSDADIERYEKAKREGAAALALDLLHPSSTLPMIRVCEFFGIEADQPAGRWKKPSLWSRLFRRG